MVGSWPIFNVANNFTDLTIAITFSYSSFFIRFHYFFPFSLYSLNEDDGDY